MTTKKTKDVVEKKDEKKHVKKMKKASDSESNGGTRYRLGEGGRVINKNTGK